MDQRRELSIALYHETKRIVTKVERTGHITRGDAAILAGWNDVWEYLSSEDIAVLPVNEEGA